MSVVLLRQPLRARFWFAASLLAAIWLIANTGNVLLPHDKSVHARSFGHDFLAFYTAGHFLNAGEPHNIYDLDALRRHQFQEARRLGLDLDGTYGPFWNPPFYAWMFAPLARMPFFHALHIWWSLGLAALAFALAILIRQLPDRSWRTTGLLPLLILCSLPFNQALLHGQNTFTSLLILTCTTSLWLGAASNPESHLFHIRADFLAGLVAGLMAFKPQLAAVVAVTLVITLGRRALIGLLISAGGLVVANCLLAPMLMADWLLHMPANLRWFQEQQLYHWERHVTFKAFWRLLLQGHALGPTSPIVLTLTGLCTLGIGTALLSSVLRTRRVLLAGGDPAHRRQLTRRTIAATFLAMPLLMPFYFDYDLLLLAIPAVLLAADIMENPPTLAADHWIIRAWTLLFLYTLVAPGVGRATGVQFSVPLLASVALLQCSRVHRRQDVAQDAFLSQPQASAKAA
jgi:hypothetical protein